MTRILTDPTRQLYGKQIQHFIHETITMPLKIQDLVIKVAI